MEHLYGSLFKTTEGAYGPLCSHGVVHYSEVVTAIECTWWPSDYEDGTWSYAPPHSLLIPRGLI